MNDDFLTLMGAGNLSLVDTNYLINRYLKYNSREMEEIQKYYDTWEHTLQTPLCTDATISVTPEEETLESQLRKLLIISDNENLGKASDFLKKLLDVK